MRTRPRRGAERARPAEPIRRAADSFLGVDGESADAYVAALAGSSEHELVAGWRGCEGLPRGLGELLWLLAELRDAYGGYRDLLAAAGGADPSDLAARYEARLMLSRGDLRPVAKDLARLYAKARSRYVEVVGHSDDAAEELDERSRLLLQGPRSDGGFIPDGPWA